MIPNKLGRPPNDKNRNIIKEILDVIDDENPIRFKDLRKKVKMSSATLVKYLDYLHLIEAIEKKPVKSGRGKRMEYSKSKSIIPPWDKLIKKEMDSISNTFNHETPNFNRSTEYIHAFYILNNIRNIDLFILEFLKLYRESEKKDQEKIFETYMFLIKGVLKELTQFTSVSIETMKISNNILKIALMSPKFDDCIDYSIERCADLAGLKYTGSCSYSNIELKNLFSQDKLEEIMIRECNERILAHINNPDSE